MTVLNYMARQRARIINGHEGEECVFFKGESAPVSRSAAQIIAEAKELEGLNVAERMGFFRYARRCEKEVCA